MYSAILSHFRLSGYVPYVARGSRSRSIGLGLGVGVGEAGAAHLNGRPAATAGWEILKRPPRAI